MAVASQHRRVFVGNIPYDATEEQLVQICEEVGPVVSFRLVIDKETGKPKGYGFCEYKDEETALSARRNLQGYEINGRQLRVDFAENDKNADRNREQGRGGPGLTANADPQKQFGGSAARGDSSLLQPVGLPVAMAAATVMAGALGSAQTGGNSNQNGLQSQPVVGTDPLTLHLAKVPKNQLIEVMSDLKAQIMLGMVTPKMLQTPNIRQATGPVAQSPMQDGQQVQQPSINSLPGLPPLSQNKVHFGIVPQSQGQTSAGQPNSLIQQAPVQPRFQTPQLVQHQVIQQAALPAHLKPPANLSIRPEIQVANPALMGKQVQTFQSSLLARPLLPDNGFQPSTSNYPTWARKADPSSSLHSELYEKPNMANEIPDQVSRPRKLLKLEDTRSTSFSPADVNVSAAASGSSQGYNNSRTQIPKPEEASESQKRNPELSPNVESALLHSGAVKFIAT